VFYKEQRGISQSNNASWNLPQGSNALLIIAYKLLEVEYLREEQNKRQQQLEQSSDNKETVA
jgi:hypothetical protein